MSDTLGALRLKAAHLSKSFGGAQALKDVSLEVAPGEVHGLLGENGSGKSTLIKILSGFHAPDPGGELEINGEPIKLPVLPSEFHKLGMSFVHQDLGLIPSLSVLENLRIGELCTSRRQRWISWPRERARAREVFEHFGLRLDPRATVAELAPLDRALLAIVRAFESMRESSHADGHLLVLDEPTVFLPRTGTEQLFGLVRSIVAEGASVIFVSHDLDEVREVTDRVTVLRDGRAQGTVVTADTTEQELIRLIIGREFVAHASAGSSSGAAEHIRVHGLRGEQLDDISFSIAKGEVLGITGLAGSGIEELPYLLLGATSAAAGRLELPGESLDLARVTPAKALAAGLALVPGDRQRDGAVATLSVGENMMLQVLDDYAAHGFLRRGRMGRAATELAREYDVRPADPRLGYSSLSGGNQQKALLAKWLQTSPQLLVLHEPTQGVDIGARQQIFRVIAESASTGMCVLCSSSDCEQLAAICDRVLVLGRGRIVDEVQGAAVTKESLMERVVNSVSLVTQGGLSLDG